ncbi:hypothetical protein JVT61DRAFT_36 [Boletus reticuloceps]|uniref:Uncharacterized protein n=1 Tax=Boletus reticuloceps TaxID=495285 RepID=A0A8I2Z0C4_9AGAM|nr:hypothetical protein JVT61DRAFT_36 [Boletus reticuloceps]
MRETQRAFHERHGTGHTTASGHSNGDAHQTLKPRPSSAPQMTMGNTGISSIQVPKSATVIEWPLRTVAPTLEWDNTNLLQDDEAYICCVAFFLQALPGSSFIDILDPSLYRDAFNLIVNICKYLSTGRPVLVPNFEDSSSFQFSKDGLL